MPFRRTFFLSNNYYHVYNRGNSKKDIFLSGNDYLRFISKLSGYSQDYKISVLAYCLMPNHFHLLVRQNTDTSLSEMVHRLSLAYSMYFNLKYDDVGPVFQGRFKAKPVDNDQSFLQVLRYIHQNPKNIIRDIANYKWSSHRFYLGMEGNNWVNKGTAMKYFDNDRKSYKEFVGLSVTKDEENEHSFN